MQMSHSIAEVRERVRAWRAQGDRVALVPTMGNLHEGHVALVTKALALVPHVVVTIFVNPLQFGAGEDFNSYPRTPAADAEKLADAGAELLFLPSEEEMYPNGREDVTRVEVPELSDLLCGASRPGHFRGVATVVSKLFNIVQPDVALFGEKDYQQLLVIRRMAADLSFPIEILGVPTVREADGVAKSSRNSYLTTEERARAPGIYQTLRWLESRLQLGERHFDALEREAMARLGSFGFKPDYVAIRSAEGLKAPLESRRLVILTAARLGRTRLIDNLQVSLD
jgi:pantoate--beta-alanine ligase